MVPARKNKGSEGLRRPGIVSSRVARDTTIKDED
jgi:hypothetical protein